MGREYKFRGKHRDLAYEQFPKIYPPTKSSFSYGTGIYNDGINTWLIIENKDKKCFAELKAVIVVPETVGQFTGRIDDSEQENDIYDNDIVTGTWLEPTGDYNSETRSDTAKVYWDDECGQWMVKEKTTGDTYPLYDYCDEVVVIGNMTDNPELMEMK